MTAQQKAGMTRVEADIPMDLAGRFAVEAARQGLTMPQLVGMAAVSGAFGMANQYADATVFGDGRDGEGQG